MAKIIGIDLQIVGDDNLPVAFENDDYNLFYNAAGGNSEFVTLEDARNYIPGTHVVDSSYVQNIEHNSLNHHFASNKNGVVCSREVAYEELYNTTNPYGFDSKKKELFDENIQLHDAGDVSSDIFYVGSKNDYRSVKLAQRTNGTVWASDYHVIANAYYYGVPFVFRPDKSLLMKFAFNKEDLKSYIFDKINHIIDSKKRERV